MENLLRPNHKILKRLLYNVHVEKMVIFAETVFS